MAKGSGGTRKSIGVVYQSITDTSAQALSMGSNISNSMQFLGFQEAREAFEDYDEEKWEKTLFTESGGFLVTELDRKTKGQQNKQESEKFEKEQRMCKNFAQFGFQIEHLAEIPGESSADVRIVKHPDGIVRVNGQLADLKSTKSANNIVNYAKKATKEQGAKYVLFEFTSHNKQIPKEINKLKQMGIQGYYYYSDEDKYYSF